VNTKAKKIVVICLIAVVLVALLTGGIVFLTGRHKGTDKSESKKEDSSRIEQFRTQANTGNMSKERAKELANELDEAIGKLYDKSAAHSLYELKAAVLGNAGFEEDALKAWGQALESAPPDLRFRIYMNMAEAYNSMGGKKAETIDCLEKALASHKESKSKNTQGVAYAETWLEDLKNGQ
jgi:tetratricopeptide (TPR) repeat protein